MRELGKRPPRPAGSWTQLTPQRRAPGDRLGTDICAPPPAMAADAASNPAGTRREPNALPRGAIADAEDAGRGSAGASGARFVERPLD